MRDSARDDVAGIVDEGLSVSRVVRRSGEDRVESPREAAFASPGQVDVPLVAARQE